MIAHKLTLTLLLFISSSLTELTVAGNYLYRLSTSANGYEIAKFEWSTTNLKLLYNLTAPKSQFCPYSRPLEIIYASENLLLVLHNNSLHEFDSSMRYKHSYNLPETCKQETIVPLVTADVVVVESHCVTNYAIMTYSKHDGSLQKYSRLENNIAEAYRKDGVAYVLNFQITPAVLERYDFVTATYLPKIDVEYTTEEYTAILQSSSADLVIRGPTVFDGYATRRGKMVFVFSHSLPTSFSNLCSNIFAVGTMEKERSVFSCYYDSECTSTVCSRHHSLHYFNRVTIESYVIPNSSFAGLDSKWMFSGNRAFRELGSDLMSLDLIKPHQVEIASVSSISVNGSPMPLFSPYVAPTISSSTTLSISIFYIVILLLNF